MKIYSVVVSFEFTDAYISIVDNGEYFDEIESKCIKLCEVFDFEYELIRKNLDSTPHLKFRVTFVKNILTFQHYMNVLEAFAQEYQVLIASAQEY